MCIRDRGEDDGVTDDYIKEKNRKMLSESWGVTDRSSADAVLLRLLESARATGSAWDYSRDVYKRQGLHHAPILPNPHTIIQTDMGIGQNPFLPSVSIALHILLQYNLIRP